MRASESDTWLAKMRPKVLRKGLSFPAHIARATSPDEINSSGTLNNKQLTNRLYYIKEHFSHSSMTTYRDINVTPPICVTNVTSPTCVKNVTSPTCVTNVTSPTCVTNVLSNSDVSNTQRLHSEEYMMALSGVDPPEWSLSNDG